MKTLKDFISILDWQTLIVTILAIGSTFLCQHFGLVADVPTGLIGLAVVFPIVFSINAAYRRREEALKYFSGLKGNAVALHYGYRDWLSGEEKEISRYRRQFRKHLTDLFKTIEEDLSTGGRNNTVMEQIFNLFSNLSKSNEMLRENGVSVNEVAKANQYVHDMIIDYERMRNIAAYRTPIALRAYSSVFLNFFPIAFGPYFAMLCTKSTSFPAVGYLVAGLYSLVLVSLDNIQEKLENPFDSIGIDDIELDFLGKYKNVINGGGVNGR